MATVSQDDPTDMEIHRAAREAGTLFIDKELGPENTAAVVREIELARRLTKAQLLKAADKLYATAREIGSRSKRDALGLFGGMAMFAASMRVMARVVRRGK